MKPFSPFFLMLLSLCAAGQQLRLEECYRLAEKNFPAIKKQALILQSTRYSLENAARNWLPQLSVNGQASYQTDVTKIPLDMPGIPEISKDQYRIQGELSQTLYDGGHTRSQKEFLKIGEAVQLQQLEVSLQTVKERVTQLFFSILLQEAQLKQQSLFKERIATALEKATAAEKNGTASKSNVYELKAEWIKADMGSTELLSDQAAYRKMLALLTGTEITAHTALIPPTPAAGPAGLNRPELKLFDLQKQQASIREKQLASGWAPKIAAFVQGGYGRPALNMLNNAFDPFAIGGIRLTFPISNLYTYQRNRKIIELTRKSLEADRATFLQQTTTSLIKEENTIDKYKKLLLQDEEAIAMRAEVSRAARVQQENGVITIHEYITQLNAEHQARQLKSLHEVQLLNAQCNYQIISGN